ncbi:ABC transporter permease, partial [Bauldia litoralis]
MSTPATHTPEPAARRRGLDLRLDRFRGLATAIVVFAALLLVVDLISAGPLSYFDISFLSSGGATLALAAVGQTIVILSGGFDLSAGAVLSLVNVVLATTMDPTDFEASIVLWTAVGIGVGMLVGAFNGFFIAFVRLQPIVVTLSTMFIIQGITLLILDKPGGFVSPSLGGFYLGDLVPGWIPMPIALLFAVGLFWMWLKRTRFGTALYAVGSDPNAAAAAGLRVDWTRFAVYVVAGGFYGLGGVFISAQTGSGDPLVGNPLLLSIFAAVVVGGTRLGGGRGGPIGSIFGAYILMIVVNILLVLNVSAYYSTIAEGLILLLAVLAGSISRGSTLAHQIRGAWTRFGAWRAGTLPSQIGGGDRRLAMTD